MSYFNEDQQRSMWTAEDHAKNRQRRVSLSHQLLERARLQGVLSEEEEAELLMGLLDVVKAPQVPQLARRALVELCELRKLAVTLADYLSADATMLLPTTLVEVLGHVTRSCRERGVEPQEVVDAV